MVTKATPLLDDHRKLGAKLTEFAGWEMPLQYRGVVAEHHTVRSAVGVFDVSHLGKLRVTGPSGQAALDHALTADVGSLEPGAATYSLVLTDDGGCVDDVFVYRLGHDDWMVVPNAANVDAVAEMIASSGENVADEWDRYAILAIQGPASYELVDRVWPQWRATDLKLHRFTEVDVFGERGLIARTGYTGERGFELYAPASTARHTFATLLDGGAEPIGLGARDTLRLEMGYALYGHEITTDVNPLEAGLGWVLAWDTPFRGRDALEKVRAAGAERKLFAVRCVGRGVPRSGYRVLAGETPIGDVTSGNFSPTLGSGIALALGPADRAPEIGDRVAIEARGRLIEGDIVKPPFIPRGGSGSAG
ncbi:MAG: glycine cleavage system aminomethyltransferase GcvT [Actinomycetota bacterium]|nr:glycine cleavage system aminomethyltransferase GcvT [Actinomycetota bacterium]